MGAQSAGRNLFSGSFIWKGLIFMPKRFLCLFLVLLCAAAAILPACADETKTITVPVSAENSKEIESALLDFIDEHKAKTPSVSITVFDAKQDICNIAYGYANVSEQTAVDENTVYEWGSISKLLVWTSAMQLYEQGKLDLNEDIRTYLPEGFLSNLSYKDPITMIDLMNHAAGFQETTAEIESESLDDIVPLDHALKSTAPAQVARPGETVSYSNWGAALGGYVVSCVSGMDYVDYVHKNIFDKLGMDHTYLSPDATDNEWAAQQRHLLHSYMLGFADDSMTDMGECRKYINLYPAGSAGGTISDLAKFAKAFLCDGKDCPLFEKDDTLDLMLSPSRTFGDGSPRICHGMFYTLYGDGLYGHGGNTEGCSSDLQLDLKNKTGYVMMINTQSDRVYTQALPELLYGAKEIPEESGFEPVDISGHYRFGRSCGGAGMLKIGSPIEDPLTIYKQNDIFTGSNGIAKIEQVSDSVLKVYLINNTSRYYGIQKDANGNVARLETYMATDITKISNAQYYTEWIMLILLAASIVLSGLLFIFHLIRIFKFKDTDLAKFKKSELTANLMAFLMLLEFAFVFFGFRMFIYGGRVMYAAVSIILCVLALVEAVMLIRCRFFGKDNKPPKMIMLNIETVLCALTIVGIIYWRLFQWWGF